MQKTMIIKKRRYTGKQLAALMVDAPLTHSGYHINVAGKSFICNYMAFDGYYYRRCDHAPENSVALKVWDLSKAMFNDTKWLTL